MDLSLINSVRLGGDLNGENFTVSVEGDEEDHPPPISRQRAVIDLWKLR
jgi:hypothetical protein